MKKYDLVKLIKSEKYQEKGLHSDLHGVVINKADYDSDVLFLNEHNMGDAIIVKILNEDLEVEKETLPDKLKKDIEEKLNFKKLANKEKLETFDIKAYDLVELLVEENRYTKFGVYKGMRGCVMEDAIIRGECLVDFSGIDENGKFYGDCISVKIKDLKKIS